MRGRRLGSSSEILKSLLCLTSIKNGVKIDFFVGGEDLINFATSDSALTLALSVFRPNDITASRVQKFTLESCLI